MYKTLTKLDLSTIPLLPMGGRGITESVEWEAHGELRRDANGNGFVTTVPGEDKLILTYTCSGDWAAPAVMGIPLLTLCEVTLIDHWDVPFAAGQTSTILPRPAWSDADMELLLIDKTTVPRSEWEWVSPKVVTLSPQAKPGFLRFRPKAIAFLTDKPKDRGEWTGKVNWTLGFKEQ